MSNYTKSVTTYANAIYQNSRVGMQSITDIITSVKDEALLKELKNQYKEFELICDKLVNFAEGNMLQLKDNNLIEKSKMWLAIKMSTLFNTSQRKIAEMVLIGSVMGLLTTYKDKSDHKNLNAELDTILAKLQETLEENYLNLKKFLMEM